MPDNVANPLKAGALILNKLAMFNEAALLMEQKIELEVFDKIQEIIADWTEGKKWKGEQEWHERDFIWLAPNTKNWDPGDDELNYAWFAFNREGETNSYDVADLCNCGQTRLGFSFIVTHSYFGNKTKWKTFCKNIPEKISQQLSNLGFVDQGGNWFLPLTLDNVKLAKAYENDDYVDALEPLNRVLQTIFEAQPIFDKILEEAAKKLRPLLTNGS